MFYVLLYSLLIKSGTRWLSLPFTVRYAPRYCACRTLCICDKQELSRRRTCHLWSCALASHSASDPCRGQSRKTENLHMARRGSRSSADSKWTTAATKDYEATPVRSPISRLTTTAQFPLSRSDSSLKTIRNEIIMKRSVSKENNNCPSVITHRH